MTSDHAFRLVDKQIVDDGTSLTLGAVSYAETLPSNEPNDSKRFVTLSIAPARLELDLDIGLSDYRDSRYSIYELHHFMVGGDFPPRTHNLSEAVRDVGQLLAEFERLTTILRTCGDRFFEGDPSLWDDLRLERFRLSQIQQGSYVLRDAEKAFKAKKWEGVLSLLEPLSNRLGKVDAARLSYAKKQLGKSSTWHHIWRLAK